MDMTGQQRVEAPREKVWHALNDPDVLRQCIPGAETVEKLSDTEFKATVTVKVGPVKARFQGNVTLTDVDPPNGYTITGEGKGGAAGFGKGSADVKLSDDGGATVLDYQVNANVGGKLAQLGSRLIDSTAKKMADDFFTRFNDLVSERPAAEAPAEAAPSPAEAATAAVTAARRPTWRNPILWVAIAVVVILVVLLLGGGGG